MSDFVSLRSPQEKRRKSRTGCKACKARRIKCDETIPECHQCSRRKLKCPGYAPTLKWSYKHEKRADCVYGVSSQSLPQKTIAASTKEDEVLILPADVSTPSEEEDIDYRIPTKSRSILPKPDRLMSGLYHVDLIMAPAQPFSSSPFSIQGRNSDGEQSGVDMFSDISLLLDGLEPRTFDQKNASPTCDLVLCSTAFELKFHYERICGCLCAYDSAGNPIRSLPLSKVDDSILYHHLLKYIIAAYLDTARIDKTTEQSLMDARMNAIFCIEDAVHSVSQDVHGRKTLTETLLALIMYGLASSWDGSNNTGIKYYQVALSLYSQASYLPSHVLNFLQESLVYWWAGLSFAIDVETDTLVEPPDIGPQEYFNGTSKRRPHPLTGVSPKSHVLLGKVGCLVHIQRRRALRSSFTTLKGLTEEHDALQAAQTLEEDLLSLHVPPNASVAEENSAATSTEDLRLIAETFRLAGLLLLYRCFPDILEARMNVLQGQNSPEVWLTELALHILEILSQTGISSGTRSVEQIILVIIASELRKHQDLSRSAFSDTAMFSDLLADSFSNESIMGVEAEGRCFDLLPSLAVETPVIYGEPTSEVIEKARQKLLQRVAAVRKLLPYRSVAYVEALIREIWCRSDRRKYMFWVDLMIEKGWAFILA